MRDYEKLRQERFAALPPVLKEFFGQTRPTLREMGVAGMRQFGAAYLAASGLEPGVSFEDVTIEGPNGPIQTRVYTPEAPEEGPRGIYLHTHGGGYVMFGGLGAMDAENSRIAKASGCVVVAPDFRLPPEHPFPQPLDDCYAAFQWTATNAERLGGRSDGICVGGGCTGGNIAAAVTLMAQYSDGPKLGAQYLISTVFDSRYEYESHYENDKGYALSHDDCVFVTEQYLQDMDLRFDWRASPILAPTVKDLPPTYIRVGEWDVLRDESIAYANRLKDAGVDVTLVVAPQESHVPTPLTADKVLEEMAVFLRRTVGPGARRAVAAE